MDFTTQLRRTYLAAVPHTLFTALIWITSAAIADLVSPTVSIYFFIATGSFVFAGGELIRKIMGAVNLLSQENKLPQLFMLLAFTIPASYPLIFMACRNNINLFFPAFTVLVGAHYLPFIYGYGMPTFGVLAMLLVAAGSVSALLVPASFSFAAYLTGGILILFAILHYRQIKREL